MDISKHVARMIAPLARRIRLIAARAVVSLIDDATKLQGAQVKLLADEVRDQVERFQQYGYTSVPFPGAEGIYLSLNGSRDHGVVICIDDRRFRLKNLRPGEVALYDDQEQVVHLTRDGILIKTPKRCRIDALDIELHASHSYSWDVHGFGERWTWTGGTTWEHKTWQQGATIVPVTLPINPPEGP